MRTPFPNEIELNFAWEAVKNERLGLGPSTNLLAISLSINDYVGHEYGPYSPQVADTTLRTDRYLAAFLADLDKLVGLNNVWIVLSADHGVAPTPEFIHEHSLGMGRLSPETIKEAVEAAMSKSFGQDQWVDFAGGANVYLNSAALQRHEVERSKAESVAAQAATSVPGIQTAFTRTQILTGTLPDTPLARKAANSFTEQRGGDVFLIATPYAVSARSETSTTHGSPWNYDAQVPLILWGSAFRPGVYYTPCQPIDLAPTLAAILGLSQPSGAVGIPLSDAIK